jgi:branched-chain amino acid transport system substrate-binding protein
MSRRFCPIPILLLSLLFALIGCARQPEEVRLGLIAMLSGPNAPSGQAMSRAASLAVSQVNARGGLRFGNVGHPVRLFIEDDHNNPEAALEAARKLVYSEKVAALVGPQFSANAIPVARFADKVGVVLVAPMSTNPETTAGKTYVFRIPYLDTFQGTVLARFAITELKARTAAILYDVAEDYNRTLAEVFRATFVRDGGEVVAAQTYTTDRNTDFTRQLKAIARTRPDVLFLPNYSADAHIQGEQARALGIAAVFLGGDGWDPRVFTDSVAFEGSFVTRHWDPSALSPSARSFLTAFEDAYGEVPEDVAATTYDAVELLFTAIQSAGSSQSDAVRAGLSRTRDFPGVTGTITYRGTGDPVKSALILRFKDGKGAVYAVINP